MVTKLSNSFLLKPTRKYLRDNLTEAELVLWEVLKDKKLKGRKFRRQHSIGYYIVDFYCSSEKLAIELDGQQHFTAEGEQKDKERDAHLKLMDVHVLRFENKELLNNLTEVIKKIKSNFKPKI